MLEYDFLKLINDYVRSYRDFLLPVIICDRKLEVYWSNPAAKSLYPHLTDTNGVRSLLSEFCAEDLFKEIKEAGSLIIDGALSLSDSQINLVPIPCAGETVGVMVMIANASAAVNHAGVVKSSMTPALLEKSIRESVGHIFTAMDAASIRADMLNYGWVKNTFNSVAQSGYQILRIASNISQYSRFQVEPPRRPAQSLDVFDLIHQSKPVVEALAEGMGIPVTYSTPDEPSFAAINASYFQSAFFNVLHNSLYFTKDGNEVSITGEIGEAEITLRISDKGVGIPAGIMSEIFKPYFSYGHDTRTAGIGLGLFIAKTVFESAGGKLEAQSVLGEGTQMTITLPRGPLSRRVTFAAETSPIDNANRFSSVYVGLCDAKSSPYAAGARQQAFHSGYDI